MEVFQRVLRFQPTRTIEKTWPTQPIWTLILKAAEAEFKQKEAKVNARLNELANTPVEKNL